MKRSIRLLAALAACCTSPVLAQDGHGSSTSGPAAPGRIDEEATAPDTSAMAPERESPGEEPQADAAGADFVSRAPEQTNGGVDRSSVVTPTAAMGELQLTTLPIPPGARIVQFDRSAWLAECRDRLATYEDAEREAVIGALAGSPPGRAGDEAPLLKRSSATGAHGECEAFLDDYLASAAAGEFRAMPAYYGQEYMLVPVTVTMPQRPVYREVEVADRAPPGGGN